MPDTHSLNNRLRWEELPPAFVASVESHVGGRVVIARDQRGGYSPGLATRIELHDGRHFFVKAVNGDINPDTPQLYRYEGRILSSLPSTLAVPRLCHYADDGYWVSLILEDVAGRQPGAPWSREDLTTILVGLRALGKRLTPSPVAIRTVQAAHATSFRGWQTLQSGDHGRLDQWSARHLEKLVTSEAGWGEAAAGDTLLHSDVRADNILIDATNRAWFVDWASACVGAAWFDVLAFVPSVRISGGPTPQEVLGMGGSWLDIDQDRLLPVVVALAGYFTERALEPAPKGMPTVRSHQAACGDVMRQWVRDITGWA